MNKLWKTKTSVVNPESESPAPQDLILQVSDLVVSYGSIQVLLEFHFDIRRGELAVFCRTGPATDYS